MGSLFFRNTRLDKNRNSVRLNAWILFKRGMKKLNYFLIVPFELLVGFVIFVPEDFKSVQF